MLMLSMRALLPCPQILTSKHNLGPKAPKQPVVQVAPWSATFGGAAEDWFAEAAPDGRGGMYVVGSTYSFGAGQDNAWVARVTARGRARWDSRSAASGRTA